MESNFLIIDRNKDFSNYISGILKGKYSSANIFTASDMTNSLDTIKYNSINILICEEQLDEMERFYHFARLQKADPRLLIIATTSYHTPEYRASSICHGALEALIKPVSQDDLLTLVSYSLELIEIFNKKSLLLKDILMLLKEGQVFPPATLHTLIVSLENRFDLTRSKSTHTINVLNKFVTTFNLSINDQTVLELAILFSGVTIDRSSIETTTCESSNARKTKSVVTGENISKALQVLLCSYNWFDSSETNYGDNPTEDVKFLSSLLAVINAYANLTINTVLDNCTDRDLAIDILRKFSSKRFDPAIITVLKSMEEQFSDLAKAN